METRNAPQGEDNPKIPAISHDQPSFMRLPLEIRFKIYEYIADTTIISIPSQKQAHNHLLPHLLLVSKQIASEYIKVLLQRAEVRGNINGRYDFTRLNEFFAHLPQSEIEWLKERTHMSLPNEVVIVLDPIDFHTLSRDNIKRPMPQHSETANVLQSDSHNQHQPIDHSTTWHVVRGIGPRPSRKPSTPNYEAKIMSLGIWSTNELSTAIPWRYRVQVQASQNTDECYPSPLSIIRETLELSRLCNKYMGDKGMHVLLINILAVLDQLLDDAQRIFPPQEFRPTHAQPLYRLSRYAWKLSE